MKVERRVEEFEVPLKRSDVAKILGVSHQSVDKLYKENRIEYMKIGGSIRFSAEAIRDYIASVTVSAEAR
jgi:excisionase family DNA binding protein